jgi:hypothetical protein
MHDEEAYFKRQCSAFVLAVTIMNTKKNQHEKNSLVWLTVLEVAVHDQVAPLGLC